MIWRYLPPNQKTFTPRGEFFSPVRFLPGLEKNEISLVLCFLCVLCVSAVKITSYD